MPTGASLSSSSRDFRAPGSVHSVCLTTACFGVPWAGGHHQAMRRGQEWEHERQPRPSLGDGADTLPGSVEILPVGVGPRASWQRPLVLKAPAAGHVRKREAPLHVTWGRQLARVSPARFPHL